ncbi:hypothetical protein BJ322DRAFT_461511 [Thelephora terrestris]|uniref:Uncharacterized protein n=1 Tax=Thelephora terrestris TaxID=56493 RepID=A0A9P6L224_9AGAM|nr:hypothetical protein BJ322DRAFT_461511 [Thelephora terrestris]
MSSTTTTTISSPGPSTSTSSSSTISTEATLRSLYSRATKSFLNRDIPQTHVLITSALQLIPSPPSANIDPDRQLSVWRRKWDILRLTLETTVYSTPPSGAEELPSSIRVNLMLSPQSLLASLYTRSLKFFAPKTENSEAGTGSQRSLSSRYLPPQVVVTLILASLKLNAPEVGKGMIEDWLSGRGGPEENVSGGDDSYEKIIELYCLHILPRLEEWNLSSEYLQYEGELDAAKKQVRPSISFRPLSDSSRRLVISRNSSQHSRTSVQRRILPTTAQQPLQRRRFPRHAHARNLDHHLPPSLHPASQVRRLRPQSLPGSR